MMKRILKTTLLVLIVTCGTGCTTGYWIDRGRDAADVFTLSWGNGTGIKGKVGPLSTGLYMGGRTYGLEAGGWGETYGGVDDPLSDLCLVVIGAETYSTGQTSIGHERGKNYSSGMLLGVNYGLQNYPDGKRKRIINPYWTQAEVKVGFIVSLKAGVNPGEFLDLLLGFIGIDIFDDDLERRKQEIEQENSG